MGKHILVISQYFYPESFRVNDICQEWVNRGYEVTVVTGIPNYPQGDFYKGYNLFKKRKEVWNGINIIRLPIIPRKNGPIMLSLNYISFVVSGFFWKLFTRIKADKVFIYEVSPMTQALVGVWYAKRKKIPCYIYVTDLWPENVEIITGIKNKFIIGTIGKMVDYIYASCDRIFTSSKSFISKICDRGVDIEKLEFWPQYAEEFYLPSDSRIHEDKIPQDRFNVLFAGNIGYAQGLGILVDVAKKLKNTKASVRFNLLGDGRYKAEMLEKIKKQNVEEYFSFLDKVAPSEISEYMSVVDAALICLSKSEVFAMTIPAKTQSCMACGKAILVSADGEVREVIEDAKCGLTSASTDVDGLYNNIIKMTSMEKSIIKDMGLKAREYYDKHFLRKKLLDDMGKYL